MATIGDLEGYVTDVTGKLRAASEVEYGYPVVWRKPCTARIDYSSVFSIMVYAPPARRKDYQRVNVVVALRTPDGKCYRVTDTFSRPAIDREIGEWCKGMPLEPVTGRELVARLDKSRPLPPLVPELPEGFRVEYIWPSTKRADVRTPSGGVILFCDGKPVAALLEGRVFRTSSFLGCTVNLKIKRWIGCRKDVEERPQVEFDLLAAGFVRTLPVSGPGRPRKVSL